MCCLHPMGLLLQTAWMISRYSLSRCVELLRSHSHAGLNTSSPRRKGNQPEFIIDFPPGKEITTVMIWQCWPKSTSWVVDIRLWNWRWPNETWSWENPLRIMEMFWPTRYRKTSWSNVCKDLHASGICLQRQT